MLIRDSRVMLSIVTFIAYHTRSKAMNERMYRRYCCGWGYRFLGIDLGQPPAAILCDLCVRPTTEPGLCDTCMMIQYPARY